MVVTTAATSLLLHCPTRVCLPRGLAGTTPFPLTSRSPLPFLFYYYTYINTQHPPPFSLASTVSIPQPFDTSLLINVFSRPQPNTSTYHISHTLFLLYSAHTTARRDSHNNNYGSDDGTSGGEGGSNGAPQQLPQPRPPAHQRDREMPDRPGPSRFARSLSPPPVQQRWGSNNGNNHSGNNSSSGSGGHHAYASSSSSHNMRAPTSNWKSTQEEDQVSLSTHPILSTHHVDTF